MIREGVRILKIMNRPHLSWDSAHADERVQLHAALATYAPPDPALLELAVDEDAEELGEHRHEQVAAAAALGLEREPPPVSAENAHRLQHALNCIPQEVHGVQLMNPGWQGLVPDAIKYARTRIEPCVVGGRRFVASQ